MNNKKNVNKRPWINLDEKEPPEGEIVEVAEFDGEICELKYECGVWYYPEGVIYQFAPPVAWRAIE